MSKPIHVMVVVNLHGEPDGVKNFGGILEQPGRQVEVECLPSDIPTSFDLDVSGMLIGDSLHVSDIVAEGVEFLEDPTKVIAQVAAPTIVKTAEEEAAEAAEAAEGEEAPEGEEKEKKEEEGEAAGDGGEAS
jgi:large subunit ribosomal protein L25